MSALTIALHIDGVALRSLAPGDAKAYRALLQRNDDHLGPNYADDIAASEAEQAARFAGNPDPPLMFGIVADGILIGRIDLVAVDPPRFGLGYWVSKERAHEGIASAAVAAIVDYAHQPLGATDVYAGVSHGNTASERVLDRNGFERIARFDAYDRFHRSTDEVMPGRRFARPIRHGDAVERDVAAGYVYVHELLAYLEARGFRLAPRFLGMTGDGRREILSYIDGEIGYPPLPDFVRSDEALVSVARAIRALHDAADGFSPSAPGPRYSHDVCNPDPFDCVGHGDLAPWNFVFNGSQVAGIIDWDSAGPSSRAWDLSYAAYQLVPFTPTPDLQAWGWPQEPDRSARLALFAAACGDLVESAELVDLAIVRLASMAARIEREIRAGNPAFDTHKEERHAWGYRRAAEFVIQIRDSLL
jgi:RimJ/RimL family protein N-acetyltransferase